MEYLNPSFSYSLILVSITIQIKFPGRVIPSFELSIQAEDTTIAPKQLMKRRRYLHLQKQQY